MSETTPASHPLYRWYVLGLFTLIYAFNFIDRQIITILAPFIKADLGLTDAQLGLLFGTAFALFHALFGLPLARLADGWNRTRLVALGLVLWSAMTALSGIAGNFAQLALARIGVGVGEASAAPAAISLLQDHFPRARRATVLAIYASGIYLGIGASLTIGGWIVAGWDGAFPGKASPFGLAGWQAAYIAAGLPGVALAALAWATVREPIRGAIDGQPTSGEPQPFRSALSELVLLVPFYGLFALRRLGAPAAVVRRGVLLLAVTAAAVVGVIVVTDRLLAPAKRAVIAVLGPVAITTNMVQWSAIGIGVVAAWSWLRALRLRDPAAAALMLGAPGFVALAVGGGLVSFGGYGLGAFIFVYGKAQLGLTAADGAVLGAIAAAGGGLGTLLGGVFADAARRRHPGGRLHVAAAAVLLSAGFALWQYSTTSVAAFYVADFLALLCLAMWLGPVFATAQDHVLPRMRGTAVALQFLGINLIGLGLGPYWVGLVSDVGGNLRIAILSALLPLPMASLLFLFAARRIGAIDLRSPAGR